MHWTALVTVLALFVYVWLGIQVAGARRRYGVALPATSGHPDFERINRAHMNMLEWMPIFLPAVWLAAYYGSDRWAALIGLVWVGARIAYALGYTKSPEARYPGFLAQTTCCAVLLIMALVGLVPKLIG